MEKAVLSTDVIRCQLCRHRHLGSEMSLEKQVRVNQMKKALPNSWTVQRCRDVKSFQKC